MIYINFIAWWCVSWDVILQKLFALSVPPLQQIEGDAKGKNIIITGPTSGIGEATATELANRGANVTLACRNVKKGESLKMELIRKGECQGKIDVMKLDTSDLDSVGEFVNQWEKEGKKIDVLINNAGVFGVSLGRQVCNGIEAHMITNHLGHLLLTLRLLPYLQKNGGGRVVNVSSLMYLFSRIIVQDPELCNGYDSKLAYSNSKMAQILTTDVLHQKFNKFGMDFFAVHPGNVLTNVTQSWGWLINKTYKIFGYIALFTKEQGARTQLMCAISPSVAGKSSSLFGSDCEILQKHLPIWYRKNGWGEDWGMLQEWMWHWSLQKISIDEEDVRKLTTEFQKALEM